MKKSLLFPVLLGALAMSQCASEDPIIKYVKTGESSIEKATVGGKTKYINYFPACRGSKFLLQSPPYDTKEDCVFAENEMQSVKIIKKYLESHSSTDLDKILKMHDNGDRKITPEEFDQCGLDKEISSTAEVR